MVFSFRGTKWTALPGKAQVHRAVDMHSGCSYVLLDCSGCFVVGVQVADSEKIVRARMPAGCTYTNLYLPKDSSRIAVHRFVESVVAVGDLARPR